MRPFTGGQNSVKTGETAAVLNRRRQTVTSASWRLGLAWSSSWGPLGVECRVPVKHDPKLLFMLTGRFQTYI
jgi:hypothetical protein